MGYGVRGLAFVPAVLYIANKRSCEKMIYIFHSPFFVPFFEMTVNGSPLLSSRAELHVAMGADGKRFDDTLSREISHRNAARTIRGGDFSTLWRLCIESPSQPKLASSLHNKRLSYWRLTGCGRNDGGGGSVFIICGEAATTTL